MQSNNLPVFVATLDSIKAQNAALHASAVALVSKALEGVSGEISLPDRILVVHPDGDGERVAVHAVCRRDDGGVDMFSLEWLPSPDSGLGDEVDPFELKGLSLVEVLALAGGVLRAIG